MKAVSCYDPQRRAMTLTEVLIAMAVLGILASIVLLAVDPNRQFEDANDAKRRQDLKVLTDAMYQYQIDHDTFPEFKNSPTIDELHRPVCSVTDQANEFFCFFSVPQRLPLWLLIPDYLAELPHDPDNTVEYETGYVMWLDKDGRVHASAPLGNDGEGIEIAR